MAHDALFCAELLAIICRNCDRHTLSQLSLTNRTISYLALDELWSSIENLGPLVRCMPNDLWEERHDLMPYDTISLFFRREILETDWDRFVLRAACVKDVGYTLGIIRYELHRDAFLALYKSAPPGAKLLPQARRLNFTSLRDLEHMDEQALSCSNLLLSPALTQVIVAVSYEPHVAILSMLIEQCPFVSEASLIGPEKEYPEQPSGTISHNAVVLLHQWSNLQHLTVFGVDHSSFSVLSSLPNLRVLEIISINYDPLGPELKHPKGFAQLEILVISQCYATFCVELMSYLNHTALRVVEASFNESVSIATWLAFLYVMKDGIIHDQLQSITLSCASKGVDFYLHFSIDLISPLFCYPHLSFFSLRSFNGFNFDDTTIEAMASSWEYLQVFSVEVDLISASRATYKSLVSFARHNPRLEALRLCVDATTLTADVVKQRPWNGVCNEILHTLDVRYSDIEDPCLVADFLHDIFPNLSRISAVLNYKRCHDHDFLVEKWAMVEGLLREYH